LARRRDHGDSPFRPEESPMRTATTTLAAAALLAIGGTAGAAMSARPDHAPAAVAAAPVEVRTQVVHRTVHIVRHIKPKRPKRVVPPAPAPAPAVMPARAQPVVASVAPRSARPLRTRSSATGAPGGGEREHEHEGGGDD
jgi:hypothetical protein